jgi:sugar lactone lactonase YvrE
MVVTSGTRETMTDFIAAAATGARFELAEGVLWDDRADLVRWVDIWKGHVHSGRLGERFIEDMTTTDIGQTAGAVALAEDGGLLIAAARGLAVLAVDGTISHGPDILGNRGNVRLNDGAVDPQGRFVVGSLALGPETGTEELLRVSPDGTVETLRSGIRLSNGIAFSPDGHTIYHVDTLANTLSSHSYGPGAFDLDEPWRTVLADFPAYPDGLTVSADGTLWVAQWGGSSIRRHALSGELLDVVHVDATQASCPAFVGPNLDTLAITTAQEGLSGWTDESGAIFLVDADAKGLPPHRWLRSTTAPSWLHKKETRP